MYGDFIQTFVTRRAPEKMDFSYDQKNIYKFPIGGLNNLSKRLTRQVPDEKITAL